LNPRGAEYENPLASAAEAIEGRPFPGIHLARLSLLSSGKV